jgi:hypothetical protein
MSNRLSATKKNVILSYSIDRDREPMTQIVAMRPTMSPQRAGQQLQMIIGGLPHLIGIIPKTNSRKKRIHLKSGMIIKTPKMGI